MSRILILLFLALGVARRQVTSFFYGLVLGVRGRGFSCGSGLRVEADTIRIGDNVTLGDNVRISCGRLTLEDGARIGDNVHITGPGDVYLGAYALIEEDVIIDGLRRAALSIGHHSWIGRRSILNASADLTIGRRVCVGISSRVFTHGCWWEAAEGYQPNYQPVVIRDDAWLAVSIVVQPGAVIEERVLVNSGAVVAGGRLPAHGVYAGVPATRKGDWQPEKLSLHAKYLIVFNHLNAISALPRGDFRCGVEYEFRIGRRRRQLRVVFWESPLPPPRSLAAGTINFAPAVDDPTAITDQIAVIDMTRKVSYGDQQLAHPLINALKDHALRILPVKYVAE